MEEYFSRLLFRSCLAGVVLGLVGTVYFFAGLAGFVASPLFNGLVAASLGAVAVFFCFCFAAALRQTNWVGRLIGLAILVIIICETLLGLVPPTARDELTHHLAIPKLYAQAGRILEVPIAPYAYFPMLLDMLYTPWVYWGLDSMPKLVHGLYGYLTGLLLYAYLARRMNGIYGLLGFFFFISVPAVLRLTHWGYVDLGVTYYSTATLLCLLRWREDKSARGWLILAASSAGFAVATKPNGYLAFLLLALLFLLILIGESKRGLQRQLADILVFAICGALPFLPWLAKNWQQTGNPFYPLLASFFHSPAAPGSGSAATFVSLGIFAKREWLYGESGWQIAALPLRLFLFGQDDSPQYFDGVLSPILILLLPWAFKGKWNEEKKMLFGFAALFLAFALVSVDLRARYVMLIVPPLIVLFAYAVFNLYLSAKRPAMLIAVLLAFGAYHGFFLWRYFHEIAPLAYLSGQETRVNFLTRSLTEYPVVDYANRSLPAQAKIYLIFAGRRAYYWDRDYYHDAGELPGFLLNAIATARQPDDIEKQLLEKGITHLMAQTELLGRYLRQNLTPAQGMMWNQFVARELHLSFQDRGYALYKIAR